MTKFISVLFPVYLSACAFFGSVSFVPKWNLHVALSKILGKRCAFWMAAAAMALQAPAKVPSSIVSFCIHMQFTLVSVRGRKYGGEKNSK